MAHHPDAFVLHLLSLDAGAVTRAVAAHAASLRTRRRRASSLLVTANGIALALEDLDLLTVETGYKRNRRFRFAPYLALFEESEEAVENTAAPTRSRARERTRG